MRYWIVLLIFLLCGATVARAGDLFNVSAGNSTTTVNAAGSSLANIVDNVTNNSGPFTPLAGQSFNAVVNYAGIPAAVRLQQSTDANGNLIINLKVPSVGVNQTFSSADGSLSHQIHQYLKKQGFAELAAFQTVVDKSSPAGVADGNPLAATALLQDAGYQQFALHPSPFDVNGQTFTTDGGHIVNRFWVDAGVLDGGGDTGQYLNFTFSTEFHFNDIIGLSLTSPFRYENLKGADIYSGGEIVGLPISIIPAKGGPFSWTVTPALHAAAVGSEDLISGGLIYGGQLSSSLSYTIGGFTFTLADTAGYYHGANLNIAGYHFDSQVNDVLFKNGLQVSKSFGNFFLDASGSWTNFTHDAYVDGYFSPELGVGFRFGRANNCGLRVGYTGNFGNNFNTNGGNVLLYFAY
jgi:hypothetical protein